MPEPAASSGTSVWKACQHMKACTWRVLELAPDHVPGADRVAAQPDPPAGVLEQHLLQARPEPRRRVARAAVDQLDLVVLGHHPPVGLGVVLREARDLLAGALEVHPLRDLLSIRQGHVGHRVGLEVLEAVVGVQAQLVVGQQRVDPDERVAGRAAVDPVAGADQLLGRGAAAGDRAGVEHQALVAGLGQVGGGDQAVVPAPGHHDVRRRAHGTVCSFRARPRPSSRSAFVDRTAASASGSRPSPRTAPTAP